MSCKDIRGRIRLSFHWDVFDIKGMIWKKMVSFNFGRVASLGMRTLDVGADKP